MKNKPEAFQSVNTKYNNNAEYCNFTMSASFTYFTIYKNEQKFWSDELNISELYKQLPCKIY